MSDFLSSAAFRKAMEETITKENFQKTLAEHEAREKAERAATASAADKKKRRN